MCRVGFLALWIAKGGDPKYEYQVIDYIGDKLPDWDEFLHNHPKGIPEIS